jgi:nucleoside-diphosphate-sugar epimerase
MMRLHVTGCGGFVGQQLCRELHTRGLEFSGSSRVPNRKNDWNTIKVENIGPLTDWRQALKNVDTVIHLAARAHVLKEKAQDPLEEFRRIN